MMSQADDPARPVGDRVDRLDRGPEGRRRVLVGLLWGAAVAKRFLRSCVGRAGQGGDWRRDPGQRQPVSRLGDA